MDLLAIKASVLVNLCQFEESLSIAESILSEEKHNPTAINVKADSLFNLCQFEHALVMYHRCGTSHHLYDYQNIVRGRNQKGVDNCSETITNLLRPDCLDGVAAVVAGRHLEDCLGSGQSLVRRAASRFKIGGDREGTELGS